MRPSQEEDEAFARLVDRQSRFVFRVAYAMLRNSHDAEDVVQETFLSLYRSGAWRKMNDERAFLARAAWRQTIDRIRANPKRPEAVPETTCKLASSAANPEQSLLRANMHAVVHQFIDALPEDLRQPLALSSIEELNSREIAGILDIPEGTVRSRLMRARQMLKQKLATQLEVRHAN